MVKGFKIVGTSVLGYRLALVKDFGKRHFSSNSSKDIQNTQVSNKTKKLIHRS